MAGNILPGGSVTSLRDQIANARAISSDIRHHRARTDNSRRRGPAASKLRLRYYLLPDRSEVPTLSGNKDAALIEAHHQCSYGFPEGNVKKKHSCNLGLSRSDYSAFVASLFDRPPITRFILHTCDKRKNLSVVVDQDTLHKYCGVVFLKIDNSEDQHSTDDEFPYVAINNSPDNALAENAIVENAVAENAIVENAVNSLDNAAENAVTPPSPDLAARRFIIHDQDIMFATSLQVDRERDQRRREARQRLSLRSRRRRQQLAQDAAEAEQRRVRTLAAMGEEPVQPEGVLLVFRCPDPVVNLSRRFHLTDTFRFVHTFVEASTGMRCKVIGPEGEELYNTTTTLEDAGILRNSIFNVEEMEGVDATAGGVDDANDEDRDEDFIDARESTPESSPETQPESRTCPDFQELEVRAARIRENLMPEKIVTVRRDELVEDLLDVYRTDDQLEHHQLRMEVEGEPALDIDGVKREVFTTFFLIVLSKMFSGESESIPRMDPDYVCTGVFQTIGRIMAHAFVLVGYFPIRLSKASVISILTGSCPADTLMNSFCQYLSKQQKAVVEKVNRNEPLATTEKIILNTVFSENGMCRTPPASDFKACVKRVSEMCLIYQPMYALSTLFQGFNVYSGLWIGVTDDTISEMYDKMKPTVHEVLRRLRFEFSDDIVLRGAEERIKDYLEAYIEQSVGEEGLPQLLQYWTASNTLVVPVLHVAFTSQEGTARRPFVNACIAQLNLSRMFVSLDEFVNEFSCYLNSSGSLAFDSV